MAALVGELLTAVPISARSGAIRKTERQDIAPDRPTSLLTALAARLPYTSFPTPQEHLVKMTSPAARSPAIRCCLVDTFAHKYAMWEAAGHV